MNLIASSLLCAALLPGGNRIVFDYVQNAMFRMDRAADEAWLKCDTHAKLRAHQAKVKAQLIQSFGGYPERCALNPVTTGKVQRDGYAIEKVMFESRPHHHVTANLFLPDATKFPGKRPGIVLPCGHSTNGKGCNPYQRGAVKAAKLGMVVCLYDPIDQGERRQSRGDAGVWSCAAHNQIGRRAELLGWNTVSFRLWDGMRVLDFLQSRPEVDAERLGVMGHSGGGTMTSWIMCLDDRIKCAAPSGFLSTMRSVCEHEGPQDAEQFTFGELKIGFNHLGHILLRAPIPTLMCTSHGDFFPFIASIETADNAAKIYASIGAKGNFRLSDTLGPHAWHESTSSYAADWMNYVLQNGPEPKPMEAYREEQYGFSMAKVDKGLGYEANGLQMMRTNRWEASVTPTGCTLDLPGERTVYDIMADEAAKQQAARKALTPAKLRKALGMRAIEKIGSREVGDYKVGGVKPGVFITDDAMPLAYERCGEVKTLIVGDWKTRPRAKEGEMTADIRGFGETAKSGHVFYGVKSGDEEIAQLYALMGESLVIKRAEDIIALAKQCGGGKVKLVAHGRAAIPAAFAYYVARDLFEGIEIVKGPASWGKLLKDDAMAWRFADVVHGAWKYCDWTDLIK